MMPHMRDRPSGVGKAGRGDDSFGGRTDTTCLCAPADAAKRVTEERWGEAREALRLHRREFRPVWACFNLANVVRFPHCPFERPRRRTWMCSHIEAVRVPTKTDASRTASPLARLPMSFGSR